MKNLFISFLFLTFFSSLSGEEDYVEETISIASKVPISREKVIATVDSVDSVILSKQIPRDVLSILRNSFGIDSSSNGGPGQVASIFLRGSNSNQTLVKINGVKINPSTAGGASIYNLDTDLISKIEIGSGAFSSIHGSGAIGGVINISTFENSKNNYMDISLSKGPNNFFKKSLKANLGNRSYAFSLGLLSAKTDGFPTLTSSLLARGYENQSYITSIRKETQTVQGIISSWYSEGITEYLGFEGIPLSQNYKNQAFAFDLTFETNKDFSIVTTLNSSKDYIRQNQKNFLGLTDLTNTDRKNLEIFFTFTNRRD